MTYRGRIKDGVVVLEPPGDQLPEGAPVRVELDAEILPRPREGPAYDLKNGIPVFRVPEGAPPLTQKMIDDAVGLT
jgi:hypothetical protein